MKPCPYCGTEMTNRRRVQCGSDECKRLHNNTKCRAYNAAYRAEHGISRTRIYEPWFECKECGKPYQRSQRPEKTSYCSIACRNRAVRIHPEQAPARVRRAMRKLERAARGTEGTTPFVYGCCQRCGTAFMQKRPGGDLPKYCSQHCKNVASKRRYFTNNPEKRNALKKRYWRAHPEARIRQKQRAVARNPYYHRDKARRRRRNQLKREQETAS